MEKFWEKSIQNPNLENIEKKDKQKEEEPLSQKETELIMDTMKKETELKEITEQWTDKIGFQLKERAKAYNLENSVEEIITNLKESISREGRAITNEEEIKKLKEKSIKTITNLLKGEEKEKLQDLTNQSLSSKRNFIDLLNRKLKGNITPEEKKLLDIFARPENIKKAKFLGDYDPSTQKIRISLLNSRSFKENTATAMHEFTHRALDTLLNKKVRDKKIFFNIMQHIMKEEKGEQKLISSKGEENFFKVMNGINEALAHRIGRYYGEKGEPHYGTYKDKTSPKIFKELYEQINDAAEDKSLQEFDQFAVRLYSSYANKWKENMTMQDLLKVVKETTEEIIKFKKQL